MKRHWCLLWLGILIGTCYGRVTLPVVNPGFEDGLLGWQSDSSGKTLFLAEAAHGGTMGVRMVEQGGEERCELESDGIAVKGGQGYGISFMGRTRSNSRGILFSARCYDAQGKLLASGEGNEPVRLPITGKWRRHVYAIMVPAGVSTMRIGVRSQQGARSDIDMDDFMVAELSAAEVTKIQAAMKASSWQSARQASRDFLASRIRYEEIERLIQMVEVAIHPRLFVSSPEFSAISHLVGEGGGIHALMYGRLEVLADQLLSEPVLERRLSGRRMLTVSRRALGRISTLALCYRLSGKVSYRDRCVAELRGVCRFKDWNPSHFLDVAEMLLAVATGYDWLYDELSDADRELISQAILDKGLRCVPKKGWWLNTSGNWGQVCRTGLIAGALAVAEKDPRLCRRLIYDSICALSIPMRGYAPLGNYPEGPGYWEYGTGYNVMGLELLFHVFGTDFGLSELPGFRATGSYQDYLVGPSGKPFNFSDCGLGRRSAMGIPWWFARRLKDAGLVEPIERSWFESVCRERRPSGISDGASWFFAYSMFWIFDREDSSPRSLPLVWNGGGAVPVAVMRSGWGKEDLFVGVKGGSPGSLHGHMDAGSFVFDAGSVRWFSDLGSESYGRLEGMGIDLWNMGQDSQRWKLFRLHNRGHNTLVIDGRSQRVAGTAKIVSVADGEDRKTAVVDMTEVYSDACKKALRTIILGKDSTLEIRDSLEGMRSGAQVTWGAGTFCQVESCTDRQIVLASGKRRLQVESLEAGGGWRIVDCRIPQPAFKGDSENVGFKRLEFCGIVPQDGKLSLRVRMTLLD